MEVDCSKGIAYIPIYFMNKMTRLPRTVNTTDGALTEQLMVEFEKDDTLDIDVFLVENDSA